MSASELADPFSGAFDILNHGFTGFGRFPGTDGFVNLRMDGKEGEILRSTPSGEHDNAHQLGVNRFDDVLEFLILSQFRQLDVKPQAVPVDIGVGVGTS